MAKASSSWLVLNSQSHRPVRFSFDERKVPIRKTRVFEDNPAKISYDGPWDYSSDYRVKYSDLDIVGHVNNVKYIEWCIDLMHEKLHGDLNFNEMEINFLRETTTDQTLTLKLVRTEEDIIFVQGFDTESRVLSFVAKFHCE